MADHSASTISVRGCRIRTFRGGAGQPLVILTGSGSAAWLPFHDKLAQKFDVIVPEHPGFGESDTPDWLDTVPDLANFYLDLFDQLDLNNIHLVGISLGGWAAAELSVRNTRRLASLTLVSAAGLYVDGAAGVDTFLCTDEQRIRHIFHDQTFADAMIAQALRPEFEDVGLKNRTTTAKLIWQPRGHDPQLKKWLHRIDVPTLLIWGDDDKLYPKEHAFAYQRLIPGARAVIIPDCGHLPQVEKADAFVAALEGFITEKRIAA